MLSKIGTSIILVMILFTLSFSGSALSEMAQPENSWSARLGTHVRSAATKSPTGLSPAQIQKAYNLPSTGGTGIIAIIDAYDDPTVESDYVAFSNQFGLPTTNFIKHKMTSNIPVDSGWALEISLDVQWAHAIAPQAMILLVEARSSKLIDLLPAVNYATSYPGVVAVSMSWSGSEFSTESTYDSYFTNSAIAFFASSGDNGAGVTWPSSSPNVIAVGGTTLNLDQNGAVISETAWSESGGGVSAYETEPSYQVAYNISGTNGMRAVPDVSYDADPASGFSVYDTTAYNNQTGWFKVGGTSAGAPQWAAIHSLGLSCSNSNFYQDAKSSANPLYFRDITSGSNGQYSAISGYDCVTGLGSPVTTNFSPIVGGVYPRTILVIRGATDEVLYRLYNSTSISWGNWIALPKGATIDSPAATTINDTLYVVVRGVTGDQIWFNSVNLTNSAFSGWTLLSGTTTSAPTLTSNDTTLCLVVHGKTDEIFYRFYNVASKIWGNWIAAPTGTTIGTPAATLQQNTLHLIVRGTNYNQIWYSKMHLTNNTFSGWTMLSGATPSAPTITGNSTTLCLVVRGETNTIFYRYYNISSQTWSNWTPLPTGATNDSPAAKLTADSLQIVVRGMSYSQIWYRTLNLSTTTWSNWTLLDGTTPSKPMLTS